MKRRDYSQLLIWSAVLVTVVRYMGAFIASDIGSIEGVWSEALTVLMGITGIGMGVLDTLGGAYLFDGWRQKMPATGRKWPFKFRVLTIFVMSLFVVGLFILVPFTVSRVSHQSMFDVLETVHLLWAWSFAVNLAPYILIGGVATSHRIVVSELDERSRGSSPKKSERSHEPREQTNERPSDHEQEIYEILAEIYKREQRIAGPTEIARLLNLNPHNAKGYISGKTKAWVQANSVYINKS